MKKTANRDHGFIICVILNMIFRWEWFLIAAVLFAMHFAVGVPLMIPGVIIAVWVLYGVVVTAFLTKLTSDGNIQKPERPNVNPYSNSNENYIYAKVNNNNEEDNDGV